MVAEGTSYKVSQRAVANPRRGRCFGSRRDADADWHPQRHGKRGASSRQMEEPRSRRCRTGVHVLNLYLRLHRD
jgi:hypothetical protein